MCGSLCLPLLVVPQGWLAAWPVVAAPALVDRRWVVAHPRLHRRSLPAAEVLAFHLCDCCGVACHEHVVAPGYLVRHPASCLSRNEDYPRYLPGRPGLQCRLQG